MNLSIEDIKFKIFMDFEAMQQRLNFSTIAINNIFMVKMLQDRQEFFKKCHALGLPTTLDLLPFGMENDKVVDQGKPHAANVICKNGRPLLIQVSLKISKPSVVC